jgi:1-acyl-sn-glycerol-3-phosphate acyltransferase
MGAADWLEKRVRESLESRLGAEVVKRLRALETSENEFGYDAFGFKRDSLVGPLLLTQWLYRYYFRCDAFGVENIPARGRCLFVANHSGQLPFDGVVIIAAVFFEGARPRLVRSMVEHFVPTLPFVSYLFSRWGQITGTPENCRRLLAGEEAILVFPEGARGVSKPFSDRYRLADFGHGFMRLALETRTPIVPVAVIGAEEQAPAFNVKSLARVLHTPSFPVVPYPPFFPIVPLPVKYRLYFGEALHFEGDADDDEDVIDDKVRAVRNRIQSMIHVGLRERKRVFW